MANGVIVPSQASWKGVINLGGVEAQGEFEVFDSGGGWAFLFGKPLLCAFKARHNFEDDTVTVMGDNSALTTLGNGMMKRYTGKSPESIGISLTLDVKQRESSLGGSPKQDPPPREVTRSKPPSSERIDCHLPSDIPFGEDDWTSLFANVETLKRNMQRSEMKEKEERGNEMGGTDAPPLREVLETSAEIPDSDVTNHDAAPVYVNQPAEGAEDGDTIQTRSLQPFKPEHVACIMKEVTIGDDLLDQQRTQVQDLICEFADCFTLSMKKVNAIPGAVHKLNIPEGTKLQIKVPPRSYNPVQCAYLESKINEMLEAGVIRQIHPQDVRFVAQTVLAQKAHEGQGLAIDELKHRVNDQCMANDLPPEFELPPRPTKPENEPL